MNDHAKQVTQTKLRNRKQLTWYQNIVTLLAPGDERLRTW